MLDNKRRTKKKIKNNINFDDYEDNLQSMRSWVRKIEQSTNSVSSRLAAVEKRISRVSNNEDNIINVDTATGQRINKIFANLDEMDDKDFKEISKILTEEISIIQQELISQENEISLFNEKIEDLTQSFKNIKGQILKKLEYEKQVFENLGQRVNKIENRAPPVMKIGNMEIPIEIAGVVAGSIAIFAAFMVYIGEQSILTSPLFLGVIGLLFIGSALAKTFKTKKAAQRQKAIMQSESINQKTVPQVYREQ